ncbi:TetR family transcriptional regulator [Actinocorallia herbida]|uniref:TetR family transcriptional regulator n=1 Tax=Actinocorallia herbida TaxID=58109 RepID=A0A3N1D1F0_9ACTN|nr:TetR family transcriptional regulator [Actinocorallia herbida]ROO86888.1 TetR family transcriptional regulator [Actinocorallia herbida]
MPGRPAFDLDAAEIVQAAVEILGEQGLDAVSMRTVAARLGVSPVPLYSRVGNKESLLDAMSCHLLAGAVPDQDPDEPWQDYALRWATALRDRLLATTDLLRLLGHRTSPYVEVSRPLHAALRAADFSPDAATRACRLVVWTAVAGTLVEPGRFEGRGGTTRRTTGDAPAMSEAESDHLFKLHLRYLVEGIERDTALPETP